MMKAVKVAQKVVIDISFKSFLYILSEKFHGPSLQLRIIC